MLARPNAFDNQRSFLRSDDSLLASSSEMPQQGNPSTAPGSSCRGGFGNFAKSGLKKPLVGAVWASKSHFLDKLTKFKRDEREAYRDGEKMAVHPCTPGRNSGLGKIGVASMYWNLNPLLRRLSMRLGQLKVKQSKPGATQQSGVEERVDPGVDQRDGGSLKRVLLRPLNPEMKYNVAMNGTKTYRETTPPRAPAIWLTKPVACRSPVRSELIAIIGTNSRSVVYMCAIGKND
ncbi:hypothetical protein K438DRAFT_1769947 [Mycena galopus ATCC 62051]|nr:hypothetical protein K438DRAFT_1769947 [Mycena galopus ATCC 62051]